MFINYPVIYQNILQWISIVNHSINICYLWNKIKYQCHQKWSDVRSLTTPPLSLKGCSICLLCLHKHVFLQRRSGAPDTPPPPPHPPTRPPSTWESNFNWLPDRGGLRLEPYSKKAGQGRLSEVRRFKLFSISHLYGGFVFIPGHWFVAGVHWVRGREGEGR